MGRLVALESMYRFCKALYHSQVSKSNWNKNHAGMLKCYEPREPGYWDQAIRPIECWVQGLWVVGSSDFIQTRVLGPQTLITSDCWSRNEGALELSVLPSHSNLLVTHASNSAPLVPESHIIEKKMLQDPWIAEQINILRKSISLEWRIKSPFPPSA